MSIEATLARVEQLRQAIADPEELVGATGGTAAPGTEAAPAGGGSVSSGGSGAAFASQLAQASAAYASGAQPGAGTSFASALSAYPGTAGYGAAGTPGGAAGLGAITGLGAPGSTGVATQGQSSPIVAAAESQVGQAEMPPGSNEGPAIAAYREAVAGSAPGEPWCAYFASWAARQAGEPIGPGGQGLGSVSAIWSWAQSAGRAIPNGPGIVPRPGDLIVFGSEHVGIVRDVRPDGSIETIEGNFENKVSVNVRSAGEASGYVSLS